MVLITREDSVFFDIGAHTGIYTIIGNSDKKLNKIISIEPYYLNFARLMCNLKLNKISVKNCFMIAISNAKGFGKFKTNTTKDYLTQGGKLDETGGFNILKQTIDNFKIDKKIGGIKIDTEGHELECLLGGEKIIKKYLPDIIIEVNLKSFKGSFDFLKNLGYKIYLIDEKYEKLILIDNSKVNLKNTEGVNALASIKDISAFNKNIK